MTEKDIDDALERASKRAAPVDPALLERIAGSLCATSLQPVRPLAPSGLLSLGLVLICALLAVAAAALAGFRGIEQLSAVKALPVFATLGILAWAAAGGFISQLVPGSRHRLGVSTQIGLIVMVLSSIFALLFPDRRIDHFIAEGIPCLVTGVLVALPATLLSWLMLRRGFAADPEAAGLAAGALGGLCGVTMLELHCPQLVAPHVIVWHTAVVPLSALAASCVVRVIRRLRSE